MRILLLLSLLFAASTFAQNTGSADEQPLVALTDFKWFKDRRVSVLKQEQSTTTPVRAVIQQNKNFERKAREQLSPGAPDINSQTIDGRSAELDRITQESRTPKPKAIDGFSYQATIKNSHDKDARVLVWEVRFTEIANPSNAVRRQFLCPVKIKPDGKADLQLFTALGPPDLVSLSSSGSDFARAFKADAVINRVEFADGAVWQRLDWDIKSEQPKIKRAVSTPWGSEVCREL